MIVLTGARQCGKSTLAASAFPDYPVVTFDSPIERAAYETLSPEQWIQRYPIAVLDEIQKLPAMIETIKAVYDRSSDTRYILLGSSQILLLKQIRETLAGRASLFELFPFTLPELMLRDEKSIPQPSRLRTLVTSDTRCYEIIAGVPVADSRFAHAQERWIYYQTWGGMPALLDREMTDHDRREWLLNYRATYLQRDVMDIARLDRLEPFVRAQAAAALRTAQTINYASLARLSDVSPPTAKEFLRYLEISYQVFLLPAYYRNPEKRLSKQPKLHFIDPGVRRAITNFSGVAAGAEFESAVVSEIIKQCKNAGVPLNWYHLRTADGREVDLLLETASGYIAFECKSTTNVSESDFRHLRKLDAILDKPLICGIVVSQDHIVREWDTDNNLWAVPAAWLLS